MIIHRIVSLLEEKSLNAADLCRVLGIRTSTMSNWKTRETDPPAKYIAPICEFLDVSCEFLLTGEEKKEEKENVFSTISKQDSEWLSLIHKLPEDAQLEFKGELKGFVKCLDRYDENVSDMKQAK